jgi:ornithine--oxo-acid transaminase
MEVIEPGTHGTTFGGNPLANAVAIASLKVMYEAKLPQRSLAMGRLLSKELQAILKSNRDIIKEVRCRGLWGAIEFKHEFLHGEAATKYSKILPKHGLLVKGTHGHTLRISPPLTVQPKDVRDIAARLRAGLVDLRAVDHH